MARVSENMFASIFRRVPAAIAPAARLAAPRPRLSPLLAPHNLPNAISSRTLGALFARPIITVNVNQGTSLYTPNDPASRSAMLADISRQEEIALSQFNRLVMEEMHRGTLKNGARRMKRFARYLQPTLARRDKRARQLVWPWLLPGASLAWSPRVRICTSPLRARSPGKAAGCCT